MGISFYVSPGVARLRQNVLLVNSTYEHALLQTAATFGRREEGRKAGRRGEEMGVLEGRDRAWAVVPSADTESTNAY